MQSCNTKRNKPEKTFHSHALTGLQPAFALRLRSRLCRVAIQKGIGLKNSSFPRADGITAFVCTQAVVPFSRVAIQKGASLKKGLFLF